MAITDENSNGFYMPVAPAYGGNNGGMFGMGGDWFAWLILVLLIGGNGWGMGGFGMGGMMPWLMGGLGGGMGAGFGLDYLYPWLNNSQHISDGFRDQYLNTQIGDLRTDVNRGFGDVQTSLCSGFAGVNAGIANAAAQAEISANARQMANMQQLFGIQSAQQQCCCDTRAGIADLRYTVATEACADRAAVGDALQAVTMQGVQNTNALMTTLRDGIQSIKDELCADRLDAERRDNANLRAELMYARGQASQVAQTAELRQSGANQLNQLVSELRSCPLPAQPVYGNTPIWTCAQNVANNNTCGCPGNAFVA